MATDPVDDRVDGSTFEIFFGPSDRTRYRSDVFVDEIDLDVEFASSFVFNNILS